MKISVKPDVFERFNSNLRIAFILVKEMNNFGKVMESKHLLKEVENLARLNFHKDNIKGNSFIQPWALAQLEFEGKAHHYHTSVERLLKTVLSGKSVAKKNTLTNIMRYVALRYLLPYGIDDAHKVEGSLTFDVVKSSGRKGVLGKLKRGDFYYSDTKGVLGTKIDYWKNVRTEVTKKTYVGLVHLVALPPVGIVQLRKIAKETAAIVEAFCEAKTEIFVLSKNDRSITV
jgi:DNA/RNA-binding domain of Phe-tRNA-synthetase-like protein